MNKGPPGNFYDPAGHLANDLYKRLSIFPPDVSMAKVSPRFFLSPEPAPSHESRGTRNACRFPTSAPKKVLSARVGAYTFGGLDLFNARFSESHAANGHGGQLRRGHLCFCNHASGRRARSIVYLFAHPSSMVLSECPVTEASRLSQPRARVCRG